MNKNTMPSTSGNSSSVSCLVAWNNSAVNLLRIGKSSDAVKLLLKAVFRLKKVREEHMQNHHCDHGNFSSLLCHNENTSSSSGHVLQMVNVPISSSTGASRRGTRRRHSEPFIDPKSIINTENVFRIFDHAYMLGNHALDCNISNCYYRAMINYNTGLALHMKGMQDDKIRKTQVKSLRLAAKFYRSALKVLEQHRENPEDCLEEDDESDSPLLLLLLLALHNNMGHIYCHLFDVNQAQQCASWLRSLVLAKSSHLLRQNLQQEYAFFCTSILLPPGREFSLAPAA